MKHYFLTPFLESLAQADFRIGIEEYRRISLLVRTAGQWSLGQFRDMLLSILAKNALQRRLFLERFKWFFESQDVHPAPRPISQKQVLGELKRLIDKEGTHPKPHGRTMLVIPLLVICSVVLAWFLFTLYKPRIEVNPQQPDSQVSSPGETVNTAAPTPVPTASRSLQPTSTPTPEVYRLYRDMIIPGQIVPVKNQWRVYLLLAGCCLFAFFINLLLIILYAKGLLKKRLVWDKEASAYYHQEAIGGVPAPLLDKALLDYLADAMHYFKSSAAGKLLDAKATVEATINQGGIPQLEYQKLRQVRSLIILEDANARALKWNPAAAELAAGMEARGIPVCYGQFTQSPDEFVTEAGVLCRLEDMEDAKSTHILLIFTDGRGFLKHRAAAALDRICKWPQAAWMDLRERRFWSDSIRIPLARRIPLYPATPEGIVRAMEGFLFEKGRERAAAGTMEESFSANEAAGSRLQCYVERLLGTSLAWAQACAMIQPITPGMADKLRLFLAAEFGLPLPGSVNERLYRLPGTWESAAGISFSWPVLKILHEGFRISWQPDEQKSIIAFILKEVDNTRPPATKGGKLSLAELKWQALRERINLEIAPDTALPRLEKLMDTPVGEMVAAELGTIRTAGNPNGLALCREPGKKQTRQLLGVMAGGKGKVRKPVHPGFKVAAAVLLVCALGCGSIGFSGMIGAAAGGYGVTFTGVGPTTLPARVEVKTESGWEFVGNIEIETERRYTINDLGIKTGGKVDMRVYFYQHGYRTMAEVGFSPNDSEKRVMLRRDEVRVAGMQEYPEADLVVQYCPENLPSAQPAGNEVSVSSQVSEPYLFEGSWKAKGLERVVNDSRELSVGMEITYANQVDNPDEQKLYYNLRDLLLETGSVDFIYRVVLPAGTTSVDNAVLLHQLELDLGPYSGNAQLFIWATSDKISNIKPAQILDHFRSIYINFTGSECSSWSKTLLTMLKTWPKAFISDHDLVEQGIEGIQMPIIGERYLLFPLLIGATPTPQPATVAITKPTATPIPSRTPSTAPIPSIVLQTASLVQLLAEKEQLSRWQGSNKLHLTPNYNTGSVTSVAFSLDGRFLASGSSDNTVKLWDAAGGKLLSTFTGHSSDVTSVAYSPDGRFLASGSSDNTVKLWDAVGSKLLSTFTGHSSEVKSVAFSPDGRFLASGSYDNTVKLWDTAGGKLLSTFTGHSDWINSVAFSPDGRILASGSSDKTVKFWDAAGGKLLSTFTGHSSGVKSVAFSPDGRFLASGSYDNTVKLWDAAGGMLLSTFIDHSSWVTSVAFSPDGRFLASGSDDNSVKLWDVAGSKLLSTFTGHSFWVTSVAFSPDGKFLASGSSDNTVKLWDATGGKLISTFTGHSDMVNSVAFSPDGRFLASGSYDNTVKLWDTAGGKLLSTFTGHSGWIISVAFSPDGRFLASGSSDKTVKLWDAAGGKLLSTFTGHSGSVYSVAFSPDGRFLASGSSDNTVKLWDVADGKLLSTFTGHSYSANSVAFSPNGRVLASGSSDNTVKLWDVGVGKLLSTLSGHSDSVNSVAFSPYGMILASSSRDNTVKFWDVADAKLLSTFTSHSGSVYSVAFSLDGRFLASGSSDNTVKLWDAAGGKLLSTFTGHSGSVYSVVFSPDGRFLASGSRDIKIALVTEKNLVDYIDLITRDDNLQLTSKFGISHLLYTWDPSSIHLVSGLSWCPITASPGIPTELHEIKNQVVVRELPNPSLATTLADIFASKQRPAAPPQPQAAITFYPAKVITAGDTLFITVTVANKGKGSLYMVSAQSQATAKLFNSLTFDLGRIDPGATTHSTQAVEIPVSMANQTITIQILFDEANGYTPAPLQTGITIKAKIK